MADTLLVQNPRRFVTETVRCEHRALSQVLDLLRTLLRQIEAGHLEADFRLISLALYYVDDFPCRIHHPKEDRYLFPAIGRYGPHSGDVLARLASDHQKDAHTVCKLHRLFVRFQAGAPGAFDQFRTALDAYAALLYEHMREEEALLDDVRLDIPESEWEVIANAFGADTDPLLGPEPHREFRILHHRIINLLPRKMRLKAKVFQ